MKVVHASSSIVPMDELLQNKDYTGSTAKVKLDIRGQLP